MDRTQRTIRVTGKSELAVKPDTIRLLFNIEGIENTYEKALNQSTAAVEQLNRCFENLGFKRSDLKTTSFGIDTYYESYREDDNQWKKRFVGYKYNHRMKIEFPIDNKKLGQVVYELAHCHVNPEFNIHYTVKDPESVKNELLSIAVLDSKTKAQILTKAIGVSLQEVVKIDYSWERIDIVSKPVNGLLRGAECPQFLSNSKSYNISIEPDNINVSDKVTVEWRIE